MPSPRRKSGRRSKLLYELRSAILPLLVFASSVLAVSYCWNNLVPIKTVTGAAKAASYEQTNRALLSATQSCQATNDCQEPKVITRHQ